MEFINKRKFVNTFNGKLTAADCARELKRVSSAILKENKLNATNPKISKKDIQKLKQVLWILEANDD